MGSGTLRVDGGDRLRAAATHVGYGSLATGVASIDGAGSSWTNTDMLVVGNLSQGSFTITNGATADFGFTGIVGGYGDARGALTVDGPESKLGWQLPWANSTRLFVGFGAAGSLNVTNGGEVICGESCLGYGSMASGVISVDGPDSTLNNTGSLTAGWLGAGAINVSSGGEVTCGVGRIGVGSLASGVVTVAGPESTWTSRSSLCVAGDVFGKGGTGTLTIGAGGTVTAEVVTRIWDNGRINYNGGSFSTASLTLSGGGDVILSPGADKTLKTTAISVDSANGSKIDLADNRTIINYTGTSPIDSIRQLLQTGSANGWTGNGITSSSAASDPTKALGYGEASQLQLTSFGGYDVDSTSLLIKYTFKGDCNLDGQVTISDLGDLASNWQSTSAVWTSGDFNYDGSVTIADLGDLASNWQAGVGSPLGMSFAEALAAVGLGDIAVPEPASGCVLPGIMGLAEALRRGRRRGSKTSETFSHL